MQVLPSLSPSALLAQTPGANSSSTLTASSSLLSHLRHASTTQSLRTLWRGVASVIMGAGPAHAMHFGTYEFVKEVAGGDREGLRGVGGTALAGAMATTASDAFMNPFDGKPPRWTSRFP
jgi:solute carrier family 25 iron transporter 28/37